MPGKKTTQELNQLHTKNTLKQPKTGYQVICDTAKSLQSSDFIDGAYSGLEELFHVSTFVNGNRDYKFQNQKDLRLSMRKMIYELTRESNEAELEIDLIETEGPSIESAQYYDVNEKYNEIKNYFTLLKSQAETFIANHDTEGLSASGSETQQKRNDVAASMRDYATAMLYNIDLKLQMRKDEETVQNALLDLKKHPERAGETLDTIIEIESAYPLYSRMHDSIKKLCALHFVSNNVDPLVAEKLSKIGDPVAINNEVIAEEVIKPATKQQEDAFTLYSASENVEITNDEFLGITEKQIAEAKDMKSALNIFNDALSIAKAGLDTFEKHNVMSRMRNIYAAARQTSFGKEFANAIDENLKSDETLYNGIVCKGRVSALKDIAFNLKKSPNNSELKANFTELFLETLEKSNEYLTKQHLQITKRNPHGKNRMANERDVMSNLYYLGTKFVGDDFIHRIDEAIENNKWAKPLMEFMADDMFNHVNKRGTEDLETYNARLLTTFELFSKHDPARGVCNQLTKAYSAKQGIVNGIEEFVANGKSNNMRELMLDKELFTFEEGIRENKYKSVEEAIAGYNKLQALTQKLKLSESNQQRIDKAYAAASEKFGIDVTHYEELSQLVDKVDDTYLQKFKDFSKEVKDAKSSFHNSTEYNQFSIMADAYVSLVGEINRAKEAGEDHINIGNLSSSANEMACNIIHRTEKHFDVNMKDANRLMTKFTEGLITTAKNYEKYKMTDHTTDPQKEPNKKLLNKDDIRKMNLVYTVLNKELPKDLYKNMAQQKNEKVQDQNLKM